MTHLPSLAIRALLDAYRSGRRKPTETMRGVLARIAAYPDAAVWISRFPDAVVLARAAALEADQAAHDLPLYGIPFAVKDNIDAFGLPTTAACPAFERMPEASATVVQRLLDAGAILVGKTNLDQFATGLVGTRSPYGAPRSVFDSAYISGGSSSGSAVAVGAGLVSFALGTDTAGSGRVPAGFNNIVGLKPTKGLLSTSGVVPACRSLDCVSIFAQTAAEAARVLDVAKGFDPADPYARPVVEASLPASRIRFGVLSGTDREFFGDQGAAALYDAAIENLIRLGGTPVEIDYAPFRDVAELLYAGPFVAERLAAIETFFTAHPDQIDPVVRDIIDGARRHSAADAFRGEYRLRALARVAADQWQTIDVLLLPTSPTIFTVAEVQADPVRLNSRLGLYTNFVNLLDYAAIAVPAGLRPPGDARAGLPAGVTLVGPAFSDSDLARLGGMLHEAADCGSGLQRPSPPIALAVAGAHLSGMPLNHQLLDLGGRIVETTRTSPDYRLLALSGTVPPKPALVRTPGLAADGIEVELWTLSAASFGAFVASLPPPMGIGKVVLADGRVVPGFLCEACVIEGATDITEHGGWRAYLAHRVAAGVAR